MDTILEPPQSKPLNELHVEMVTLEINEHTALRVETKACSVKST